MICMLLSIVGAALDMSKGTGDQRHRGYLQGAVLALQCHIF